MSPMEKKARELLGRNIARNVAAELMGMGHERFEALLDQWGIQWPKQAQAQRIILNGKQATFAEHAKNLGIPVETLRDRWKHKRKLDEPRRKHITPEDVEKFAQLRYSGKSGVVAAEEVGFHYNRLHKMAKVICTGYTEKLKTVKRHRRTRAELNQEG